MLGEVVRKAAGKRGLDDHLSLHDGPPHNNSIGPFFPIYEMLGESAKKEKQQKEGKYKIKKRLNEAEAKEQGDNFRKEYHQRRREAAITRAGLTPEQAAKLPKNFGRSPFAGAPEEPEYGGGRKKTRKSRRRKGTGQTRKRIGKRTRRKKGTRRKRRRKSKRKY